MFKLNYIPYGAQYYRAPTPLPQDWERDIAHMAKCGFNTIKIWAQWGSNNPAEGVYDFSDLHRLMDIAHENGIKVIINLIFDVAPAWYCKKYPDSAMMFSDGRRMSYQVTAYRQIGGAPGPCLNHPEGIAIRREFLEALARELGDHPALLLWDLWNEPEMGSGIENREPTLQNHDLLCYCDNCRRRFSEWLREKYKTLDALNNSWHHYYGSWDEVQMPIEGSTFNDMIDWRAFFADTMVNEAKMRRDVIKSIDHTHPTMVHTVPLPYFNMMAACSDDYRLASLNDLHGNSLGTNPFSATVSVSAAEGKPVISSEMQISGGNTYGRPGVSSMKDYKRYVFVPLSKGVKGFQYWQFRPERFGLESPAWGLTNPDGTAAPQLGYAVELNNALQRHKEAVLASYPDMPRIAVINGSENQVFDWCTGHSVKRAYLSLAGIFDALHSENYACDIVSTEQITDEKLKQYQVLIYPYPHYVKDEVAERIARWIQDGGTFISEVFFGAVTSKESLYSETVPGLGFDRIFGAREGLALTASVFHDPYNPEWSSEDETRNIIGMKLPNGEMLNGYYFSEGFEPYENGEVLAHFGDGRAAVVSASYGKGRAIIIGSLIGYAYKMGKSPYAPKFLSSLIETAGVAPTARCELPGIRADVLRDQGSVRILVVTNNNAQPAETQISIPGLQAGAAVTNMLTGERFTASEEAVTLRLDANDCDAFIVE